jgi:phenylpropionate dioxygenase-like ring-hydroxylating dioxygenase large terminal subunit
MRLSKGSVQNGRLVCRYHGWSFAGDGSGESPATPKLHAQAGCFEACERHGAVWIRRAGSSAPFPPFEADGFYGFAVMQHRMKAPLELALDNFCETEHTATVHAVFGFDPKRMNEVTLDVTPTDDTVAIANSGPPKPVPAGIRFLIGVRPGMHFYSSWTTRFDPVALAIDHWWADPTSGTEAWVRWRVNMFFTPIRPDETAVWSFAFAKSKWPWLAHGGLPWFRWLLRRELDREIRFDVDVIEDLADKSPSIEGMKLGRFDRVLGLTRERIARIYRGGPAQASSA